jgi:sortase A
MKKVQNHFRKKLRRLSVLLWIAGFVALGYCALVKVDASITQARMAASLKQAREAMTKNAPSAAAPEHLTRANNAGAPANGAVGRLEIPRIGISVMVLEGAGSRSLRLGAGHIQGTAEPGQAGNVALAGHRDTFFRPLRQIRINDQISMDTGTQTLHYRVTSTEVVDPHDIAVLKSHDRNELTLVTCYPFSYIGPAPKRYIVHASLTA